MADSNPLKEKMERMQEAMAYLRRRYPEQMQAFSHFFKKTEEGPALTVREKELINVALAVASQCEWCIGVHVRAAARAGATRDEIIEAAFMAVVMHGGPALMYMTPLLEALDLYLPESSPSSSPDLEK